MGNSKPIRVLYSAHEANLTGASRSLLDLLSGLDREQVEPTVLLPNHGPLEDKLKDLDVSYAVLRSVKEFESPSRMKAILKRLLAPLLQLRVNRFVREGKFDLVHNNSMLSLVGARAAQRAGIPYVCHVRDMVQEDHGMDFIDEGDVKRVLCGASAIVFISEFVAKKFGPWAPGVRQIVIWNLVDSSLYFANHSALFENGVCHLVLVGAFSSGKGQMDAIQATELLIHDGLDVSLTLIGSMRQEEYYQESVAYISQHDLSSWIRVLEFQDDLKVLRAESDIALMCSTSEALGRVTIEGMMSGCLVVGADAGATPELVCDGDTGLLYRAGDPKSLASRIKWAIENPDSAQSIALKGQHWAISNPAFDRKHYIEEIIALYEKVLMKAENDGSYFLGK